MADTTIQTTRVGEAIHNHHQEILDTLRGHVAAIVDGRGGEHADPSALVAFLKGDLLPHARGEEAYLYPAVDPLVKVHGTATATMEIDHEYIKDYIDRIADVTRALHSMDNAGEPLARHTNLSTLQRLCLQLEAVLVAHLDKEERVYIPLFEKYLSDEEQQRILGGMHEAYETTPGNGTLLHHDTFLDVREIAPRQRHETIFESFNALKPSEAFVLVNDHDPKPLYYQFKAELDGLFTWDYLEQGPQVWQVRVGRV
ncbi:MAG: DUF2249 domain-containing protein [Chloroflexi bacterium]|nr:DUF2249 domain-containing protein [Chloroflexota bacterium]